MSVEIDQKSFDAAIATLSALGVDSGVIAKVASRSINRALPTTRLFAVQQMADIVTAKKEKLKKFMKYDKATIRKWSGKIIARSRGLNVAYFDARTEVDGVSYKVFKKGARRKHKHAFFMPVRNKKGEIVDNIVMVRVYNGPRKPFDRRRHYGNLPVDYRMPIERVTAEGVYQILERIEVMGPVMKVGGDALMKNVDRELNYELGKL